MVSAPEKDEQAKVSPKDSRIPVQKETSKSPRDSSQITTTEQRHEEAGKSKIQQDSKNPAKQQAAPEPSAQGPSAGLKTVEGD